MPTIPEVIRKINDAKAYGKMFNGASVTYKPRGDQPSGHFFKDINNAKRFTPSETPVRLPFNGYVNFNFNNKIDNNDGLNTSTDFQNRLSSMVQSSTMPSAEYATAVQNQYNRKRITVSAVDYKPVQVTVYDTVDSLWVTMLMRMYAHLFTNPTNMYKGNVAQPIKDDIVPDSVASGDGQGTSGSFNRPFNSNSAGLNLQPANQRNFITSMDVVQYHGQKAIKYTLFNPMITSFEITGVDYTNSTSASTISLSIEYENFTLAPLVNDWIDENDLSRFSNYYKKDWQILRSGNKAENQNTSNQYPLELKQREASFLNGISRREQTTFLDSFSATGDTQATDKTGSQ
jgi:hypothetical protein